jgi:hypothetical protein
MTDQQDHADEPVIVIDMDGDGWGPFESVEAAVAWAGRKWPDQQQDEQRQGGGWYVSTLAAPDPPPRAAAGRVSY